MPVFEIGRYEFESHPINKLIIKSMIWLIALIVILVLAGYVAFKEGEVHELHKTRAMFEKFEHAHPLVKELMELEKEFDELEKEVENFDLTKK